MLSAHLAAVRISKLLKRTLESVRGFWNLQQPTPVATLQLPERS